MRNTYTRQLEILNTVLQLVTTGLIILVIYLVNTTVSKPDYIIELTENYVGVINPETGETIYFESFDSKQPLGKAIIKDNN